MTQSQASHPYPAISPCPPWCTFDRTAHHSIHESPVVYTGSNAALFTAYARCYRGDPATLHLFADLDGDGGRGAALEFSDPADMDALGTLLESLAKVGPEAIRALAAQVRAAAEAIAKEAS